MIDTLHYSVDGPTNVTIRIANRAGSVVRTLASNLAVAPGPHSVVWDGKTAAATNVPRGSYTAKLTSTDRLGNVSHGSATVAIRSRRRHAPLRNLSVLRAASTLLG